MSRSDGKCVGLVVRSSGGEGRAEVRSALCGGLVKPRLPSMQ